MNVPGSEGTAARLSILQGDTPFWRDERVLRLVGQAVSAVVIMGLLYWGVTNVLQAAETRGLGLGFDFLSNSAGFPIGESVIPYEPSDTFAYAFWVGIVNTLRVATVGIVLATLLGVLVGLARLSSNWLVSRLAVVYIEAHRNIPLLVLLFIWFRGVMTSRLPGVAESIQWPGPIYLNQRGIYMPWPRLAEQAQPFLVSIVVALLLALLAWQILSRLRVRTGRRTYFGLISLSLLLGIPLIGWFASGGHPLRWEIPVLETFNFQGGVRLTPEFSALLIGLVMYTAAFIAEVVRSGIQAVATGQSEAARAIGLNYVQVLWLVVFPQAMRVIIPPLISQYLNLTKNSSLAFFIGYPDLFAVAKIMTNQAGRAVSVFAMAMAAYLTMSLVTSMILNMYNRRVQFVER